MAAATNIRYRALPVILAMTLLSFAAATRAFAAAGSTGGRIGKTDKSVSGDVQPPERPAAKGAAKPRSPAPATSSCGKIPGNWAWFSGLTTVFRRDGTGSAGPYTATWTCENDNVTIVWSHGYIDRLRLSRDGTHLQGTNGFITVTGDRR
jgi:hypothetical protein